MVKLSRARIVCSVMAVVMLAACAAGPQGPAGATGAQGVAGPAGAQGPAGGLAASFAYSTATNGVVTLKNILVNGGSITAPVARNSTITVQLDYTILNIACRGCVDQIEIGFSNSGPSQCIYNGVPGVSPGVSSTKTFSVTAPATAGVYDLAFDRSEGFTCDQALASGKWWTGPNPFAVISVQ
jgi:hypothetical protein